MDSSSDDISLYVHRFGLVIFKVKQQQISILLQNVVVWLYNYITTSLVGD